ncbi:MAG: hypothetical protein IEMM0002_0170 [bacterium]|nr:MAG: hypothetical protein IEMM0002_0170 [bacterium]
MRYLLIALSLGVFLLGRAVPAQAHEAAYTHFHEARADKPMNPCMKDSKMMFHSKKHAMMKEGMGIILDAIVLIKDSAKNPKIYERAAAIEKRWRTHLKSHEEMHKHMMMQSHGEHHDGQNPCQKKMH